MMRRLLPVLLLAVAFGTPPARAHDLITAEVTDRYLASIASYNATWRSSTAPAGKRAEAAYQVGRLLDEIREFLNRDIASHGQVQGLASHRLVLELKARGTPLRPLPDGRFAANTGYYREALLIDPSGAREADALFRLLKGHFYDSFDDDPLSPREQTWTMLAQQITCGERLLVRAPRYIELEEARFILLIHYIQAARGAPESGTRRDYMTKADAALTQFEQLHADSLRAAVLPLLRERLREK